MFKTLVVVVITAASLTVALSARPKYIGCVDSMECAVGTCCTLGGGRFSIPQCSLYGEVGAPCRPIPESGEFEATFNTTLSYPDGQTVQVSNVYPKMCPCAHGLYCSHETATCMDPYDDLKLNQLDAHFT